MGQGSGPAHRLTSAERLELLQRVRAGETHRAAAGAVGCSAMSVQRVLRKTGGVKPRTLARSECRLSLSEREEISRGLLAGDSCRTIATRLGRSPSTISRDVAERYAAPAGRDDDVLLMEETTPLEPGHKEYKQYAPGVGLIVDGSLTLVRFGNRP